MKSIKNIYPLTIICDRYTGAYSGGKYLAFNLGFDELPSEIIADDMTCGSWWNYENQDIMIGKGYTIEEAYYDLMNLMEGMNEKR